ncbi:hypothetical protein BKP45_06880 [Anaerobacillus alkalidiazotrophicus]|uniref:Uncharacterized protein n=1 Tax=Anaerobacillus alkalidiazotrophicus TaxID=472963 RepID=A0A1S2MD34_9BACI|nr:hypothetical protein [Anaerobacillus alkalidiazotrophicus]OIJ22353.1 hypothetical protein BKP45_06880 [Anaerobacillus alkalidiazotrophicus]
MLGLRLIRGKKKVEDATHAKCPHCEKEVKIELWNKQTRAFLGDAIPCVTEGLNTKIPYQCPECFSGHLAKSIKFISKEKQDIF